MGSEKIISDDLSLRFMDPRYLLYYEIRFFADIGCSSYDTFLHVIIYIR